MTLTITLLLFAAVSFAGAGIAYATARAREFAGERTDVGMRAVAALIFGFGGSCTFLAVGLTGVFAFGGVIAWASYVLSAQRLSVFQLEQWRPVAGSVAERRPIA
jgi:hypothetical protein